MAIITLARHGSTASNDNGDLIRGWRQLPLSNKGVIESERLGYSLKNKGVEAIITSDLKHAAQTAAIVSKMIGVPVIGRWPELRTWNPGDLTGKPTEEIQSIIDSHVLNPDEPLPGGESFGHFRERFLSEIDRIVKNHPDEHILVISHGRNDWLMQSWEKNGMPASHRVDVAVFLARSGLGNGQAREISFKNQKAEPYNFKF